MKDLNTTLPLRNQSTLLRHFLAEDLALFHAYRTDAELARYQGWSVMSREAASQFVASMLGVSHFRAGDWLQLAIADPTSNALLGDIGIFIAETRDAAEIGITLARASQGQGHASRALQSAISLIFSCSPADHIRAIVDARNHASIQLMLRAGFAQESQYQTVFKGEPCTEIAFVLQKPGN